jgi:hypothetical protein
MSSERCGKILGILTIFDARDMKILFALLPILMTVEKCASNIFFHSDFELSDWGQQFQPANPVELLATLPTSSLAACSQGEWF